MGALLLLLALLGIPDEPLHERDRALLRRIAAALPPGDHTAAETLRALAPSDAREERDIGFGAKRYDLALYGERHTLWVRLLVFEEKAIDAQVVGPQLTKEMLRTWSDAKALARLRTAIRKGLGEPEKAEVPKDLREAFELLDAPLADLRCGWMYGEGGDAPAGREATEAIVAAKRADLLRLLLRSPNPEGRVYAVEGLLRLEEGGEKLTDADRAAMKAIRSAPTRIHCCAGCLVYDETAETALRQMHEDRPKR